MKRQHRLTPEIQIRVTLNGVRFMSQYQVRVQCCPRSKQRFSGLDSELLKLTELSKSDEFSFVVQAPTLVNAIKIVLNEARLLGVEANVKVLECKNDRTEQERWVKAANSLGSTGFPAYLFSN